MKRWALERNVFLCRKLSIVTHTAMVLTGNQVSLPFRVARGTRQGCLAWMLLFALSTEPLAQKITHCQDITQIILNGTTHITPLYADDLLVFLDHAPLSLPEAMNIISSSGSTSGYKTSLKNQHCHL